jgi:hypothetical protein
MTRFFPVMLLAAAALAGCVGSVAAASIRQRIINYEASLRAEEAAPAGARFGIDQSAATDTGRVGASRGAFA